MLYNNRYIKSHKNTESPDPVRWLNNINIPYTLLDFWSTDHTVTSDGAEWLPVMCPPAPPPTYSGWEQWMQTLEQRPHSQQCVPALRHKYKQAMLAHNNGSYNSDNPHQACNKKLHEMDNKQVNVSISPHGYVYHVSPNLAVLASAQSQLEASQMGCSPNKSSLLVIGRKCLIMSLIWVKWLFMYSAMNTAMLKWCSVSIYLWLLLTTANTP